MKIRLFALLLICGIKMLAQAPSNISFMIKAGILIPYLQVEFPLYKQHSLNIGTSATYTVPDKSDYLIAPSIEYRYYLLNNEKIQPYFGAYTRGRLYDVKEGREGYFFYADPNYDYQTISAAFGAIRGYQFIIKRHLAIDIFSGLGYVFFRKDLRNINVYVTENQYIFYPYRNLDLRFGIGLGYVKYTKKKQKI